MYIFFIQLFIRIYFIDIVFPVFYAALPYCLSSRYLISLIFIIPFYILNRIFCILIVIERNR